MGPIKMHQIYSCSLWLHWGLFTSVDVWHQKNCISRCLVPQKPRRFSVERINPVLFFMIMPHWRESKITSIVIWYLQFFSFPFVLHLFPHTPTHSDSPSSKNWLMEMLFQHNTEVWLDLLLVYGAECLLFFELLVAFMYYSSHAATELATKHHQEEPFSFLELVHQKPSTFLT